MTFEWLELTHTCHIDPIDPIDPKFWGSWKLFCQQEIKEIHDEERYLIDQLENLVIQFETKFTELGLPLRAFLEDHWLPAMKEIVDGSEERNAEEEQKMRELGIVVDERDIAQEMESDEEDWGNGESYSEEETDTEQFHDCEDTLEEG
ncbi:hypothetical protein ONS95_012167 [Cadophora gregata]|uniref:uncharacterized protein n=1 Tax=Cadophora gregata TaxID=51156 RepID=UPI0026DD9D70|nr:uncharacterized protein ONS95_012167 [Cadophora gregata]KAK0117845.1 hypothetical protein ONS95_012167 [Cadophora gregata]KAK0122900.1 hypothetical protein ONS96_009925 [Cadophora gregata f. sp. sojae]